MRTTAPSPYAISPTTKAETFVTESFGHCVQSDLQFEDLTAFVARNPETQRAIAILKEMDTTLRGEHFYLIPLAPPYRLMELGLSSKGLVVKFYPDQGEGSTGSVATLPLDKKLMPYFPSVTRDSIEQALKERLFEPDSEKAQCLRLVVTGNYHHSRLSLKVSNLCAYFGFGSREGS